MTVLYLALSVLYMALTVLCVSCMYLLFLVDDTVTLGSHDHYVPYPYLTESVYKVVLQSQLPHKSAMIKD